MLQHLSQSGSVADDEWVVLLDAFDLLRRSTVGVGERTLTFAGFYDEFVDTKHADAFIAELLALTDWLDVRALQARYRELIVNDLAQIGLVDGASGEERVLVAFCLYWWTSFARGYVRELEIRRDLEATGVRFAMHDLRSRAKRATPFDLLVSGQKGDVKTSTYFLYVARSFPLGGDFHIARLWQASRQASRDVVLLKEHAWEAIDGPTRACAFAEVERVLPHPARVVFAGETLVIVEYHLWKAKVLARQTAEGVPDGTDI